MFINLGKLMQQLEELQQEALKISVDIKKYDGTIHLVMNGLQQVQEIKFGQGAEALWRQGQLAAAIKEAFNEGVLESRRLLRDEVSRRTGIDLPHIPGLF
ncbi:MAG: YbaB/EbfC family nucleoid-associated protein [Thermoanaerobacteraceae bacterium]|nr:YbaB/EbfC family nucleoid-associated protein [Thermoanaerobacteraceae bacterium]